MIKNSLTRWVRPRVLGILLAKLVLSVATPLAGQPNDGNDGNVAASPCGRVVRMKCELMGYSGDPCVARRDACAQAHCQTGYAFMN